MATGIKTAHDRMQQSVGIKLCILGIHGIGKTSLALTLPPEQTLVVNMEGGLLALDDYAGDTKDIRDWQEAQNWGCLIGGPNPSRAAHQTYSKAHFDYVCHSLGRPEEVLGKYRHIFIDSISEMARLTWQYASTHERARTKGGEFDKWGAFDLLAEELLTFLRHVQHNQGHDVILVGGLDKKKDAYGRTAWTPQIEGSKTQLELPGIVDEVITMAELDFEGTKARAFVTATLNQWGYPAKDRSGRLDAIEEPHLGRLLDKIRGSKRRTTYAYGLPDDQAPPSDPAPSWAPQGEAVDPPAPPF